MRGLKQVVKRYVKNSENVKKIINKLNEVARQEEGKSKRGGKTSQEKPRVASVNKDVIYPLISEYKYNKRIYNYLLELHDG